MMWGQACGCLVDAGGVASLTRVWPANYTVCLRAAYVHSAISAISTAQSGGMESAIKIALYTDEWSAYNTISNQRFIELSRDPLLRLRSILITRSHAILHIITGARAHVRNHIQNIYRA